MARVAAEAGRQARSISRLSQRMGALAMPGYLPKDATPASAFSFLANVRQNFGLPAAIGSQIMGRPPESGERIYKNYDERNWMQADERSTQLLFVQEAQAQHYALAREAHELKVQHYARVTLWALKESLSEG